MVTLKRNQTLEECLDVIIDSAHSRFPVISEDKDHIEGILMAKDLLPFMRADSEPFSIDKVLRTAVVVPESKRVDRMLKEFRSQRYHMAIVIDEFGGVSGLVTIEDILGRSSARSKTNTTTKTIWISASSAATCTPYARWHRSKTSTKPSAPISATTRSIPSAVW